MINRVIEYIDDMETVDELQERIDELEFERLFESDQHFRDLFFWSGLSLCIGVFIGMAVALVK